MCIASIFVDDRIPDEMQVLNTIDAFDSPEVTTCVAFWEGCIHFGTCMKWLVNIAQIVDD